MKLTDLRYFEGSMIVEECLARASVMETENILESPWSMVSAVMTAYRKVGKRGTGNHNSERKRKLTDTDRRVVKRNVMTAYRKVGKLGTGYHNSERNRKLD